MAKNLVLRAVSPMKISESCQVCICNEIAINLKYHFSHCKSMENLSCHSNQSASATTTKNSLFAEAIVRTILQSFSFIPQTASGELTFKVLQQQQQKIIFLQRLLLETILQSFSFIPQTASEELTFEYFFKNLHFMLPWQPVRFSDLDKIHVNRRGLLEKHFCKKKKSKYLQ